MPPRPAAPLTALPAALLTTLAANPAPAAGAAADDPVAAMLAGGGTSPAAAPALPPEATPTWWDAVRRRLLAAAPAWTAEADQASAEFGAAVATAGDVNGDGFSDVIVGAHFFANGESFEGRVFVYHGSAAGLSPVPAWTAEGNQAQADFGFSVGTAGDVNGDGYSDVIIGARVFDNGETDEGRAFVYHGSANGLAATPAWTAEGNQATAWFGFAVATAGDVNGDGFSDVIVGAPAFDNGQTNEGRIFLYLGSAGGLAAVPAWTAESNRAGALLGGAVATAGDVNGDGYSDPVAGAAQWTNGQSNEGALFVYLGGAGGPGAAASWSYESDQSSAFLGQSVGTAGDVNGDGFSDVIAGAPWFDAGETDEGAVFVFHGSAAGPGAAPAWTAGGDQANAHLGNSVAPLGDTNGDGYADVIAGAPDFDDGETNEGQVRVWLGGPAGLAAGAAWTFCPDQAGARAGQSVATAGDVNGDGWSDALAGVPLLDAGETNEGRVFAWHGATSPLSETALWSVEGNSLQGEFGYAVASAGDVNGDGYGDVVVGSRSHTGTKFEQGRVSVFHGSASGLSLTPAWTFDGEFSDVRLGGSVGGAGDVNGDGYDDVIAGARLFQGTGRAYVWHGSPTGLGATPAWTADGTQAGQSFGGWVAGAGDVNGDGYADVIIGSFHFDVAAQDEGRAFAYHGSPSGLAATPAWTASGDQASAYFGHPVAAAGDVNGDGYGDVIVSAPYYAVTFNEQGRAYVFHGSPIGLGPAPAWTATGTQNGERLGQSAAGAGDVNGDGFSDVILGAAYHTGGLVWQGSAFVHFGAPAGLSVAPDWTADGPSEFGAFGYSVASAGDVDGDGFSDVIVGAFGGGTSPASAHVFHGAADGPGPEPAWTTPTPQNGSAFGSCVASAGDVDGDGFADAILGAPWYQNPTTREGLAILHHGNGGECRITLPRQQRTDGVTPIGTHGRSDSETAFRIRAIMLSAFGRTRLQMEHEAKPLGVPFDGTNTIPGGYFDIGSDGIIHFNRLVGGLEPATRYHWRVRAKYDLVRTPFQRNGPWIHLPSRGWNEADLRTGGTSVVGVPVPAIAAGATGGVRLALRASGPNPANGPVELRLALGAPATVVVDVLDVRGRRVAGILRGAHLDAGSHALSWDGRDTGGAPAAAGVYFVRARTAAASVVRRVVLVR